jgi:hypothetical protein
MILAAILLPLVSPSTTYLLRNRGALIAIGGGVIAGLGVALLVGAVAGSLTDHRRVGD